VRLSVFVKGASMPFQFLVVKALFVPVILAMDFQRENAKAIFPRCETVSWNHGGLNRAENAWDGQKKEPNPVNCNPARRDKGAIYQRQDAPVAPRTIQAVSVVCGTAGLCRLEERHEVLAHNALRLHNALAILQPRRELPHRLSNSSNRPVNLPKNYAIGLAEPYAGPTYEITEQDQPADVGADPRCTAGPTEDHPPKKAPSIPVQAHAPQTKGPPQDRFSPNQKPLELSPSPSVAHALIPPDLHPSVHQLMDRYQRLWSGWLGQIDVTPHSDTTPGQPHPVGGKAGQAVSPGSPVGEYSPRKGTPKSTHARRRPREDAPSDKHELCDWKFPCPRRRPRGNPHASPSHPVRSPQTLRKPPSDTLKGPSENPPIRAHGASLSGGRPKLRTPP